MYLPVKSNRSYELVCQDIYCVPIDNNDAQELASRLVRCGLVFSCLPREPAERVSLSIVCPRIWVSAEVATQRDGWESCVQSREHLVAGEDLGYTSRPSSGRLCKRRSVTASLGYAEPSETFSETRTPYSDKSKTRCIGGLTGIFT
jgi:hypothetical protein